MSSKTIMTLENGEPSGPGREVPEVIDKCSTCKGCCWCPIEHSGCAMNARFCGKCFLAMSYTTCPECKVGGPWRYNYEADMRLVVNHAYPRDLYKHAAAQTLSYFLSRILHLRVVVHYRRDAMAIVTNLMRHIVRHVQALVSSADLNARELASFVRAQGHECSCIHVIERAPSRVVVDSNPSVAVFVLSRDMGTANVNHHFLTVNMDPIY